MNKRAQDLSQYATVPQGAIATLLAVSSTGGSGSLSFVDADGQSYTYNYFFYSNSLITFYSDEPGRHVLSFFENGKLSNMVVIDVAGTYTPTSNYLPPPNYHIGYYPGFYGFNNVPSTSPVVVAGGDNCGDGGSGGDSGGDRGSSGRGEAIN